MTGHGCPHPRWDSTAPSARGTRAACAGTSRILGLLALLAQWAVVGQSVADDLDLRLRIAWGGAQRSTWSGTISIDGGTLSRLSVLGIENDVPGGVWLERNVVHIRAGTPRDYGGVDVSVVAPDDARLTVRLRSGAAANESSTETELGKLIDGNHRTTLDAAGNYLLITRAPGDRLRLTVDRPHVVYAPGEAISLRARVSPEVLADEQSFQLVAEVIQARGGERLHEQRSTVTRDELIQQSVPIPLQAPREEGVYEARLVLRRPPGLRDRFVPGTPAIVERQIQFVVFDPHGGKPAPAIEWQQSSSVDLANPNWAARLPRWWGLGRLPGVPARPPSNVAHRSERISGTSALVLPPTRQSAASPLGVAAAFPPTKAERAWCAVPMSVDAPGSPHLVTIDLPAGQVNQVGLAILEPNAAGFVYPVTRDFGVFSSCDGSDESSTRQSALPRAGGAWLTKKFLFWPKTESPMLLLTNEHPEEAARIGVVRLYRARVGETRFAESLPSEDRRIAAVMVDRPWLVESLGAPEALDVPNNQSVDDWRTFYDAALRLVDYVQLGGYNAAVLSIFADGSTIYPSEILQSTPRYDTGILASTAQDPMRKDFVELLLSAFDRAGLFVFVGLEFASPLPELERLARGTRGQQSGIEWIGADGRTWKEHRGGAAAPRYNLLNERVQEAMLRVVREVVTRYDAHPSLAGVAVQLAGNGYAQLLEPKWGFDDNTVRRFEQETGIAVPGNGPQRFAVRAHFLLGEKRREWVAWRAKVVSGFYAQLRDEVHSQKRPRELLLLPTRLIERAEIRARLRPSLIAEANVVQVLYELGLDVKSLAHENGIIFLRPTFDVPPSPLGSVAAEHRVNSASEMDSVLDERAAAGEVVSYLSLTRNRRLASFDQQNLFGEGRSFTAPLTQMRPGGNERCRALAHALAARDVAVFVEGGQTLVTEMDDRQRRALEIFRKLPSGGCETTKERQQPVTVRTYRTDREVFVCLVNESAWAHDVTVLIEAPAGTQLLELGTSRGPQTAAGDPALFEWPIELPGYGIRAARISSAAARIVKTVVNPSAAMQAELTSRIADLSRLAEQIAADRPLPVLQNPAFEQARGPEEIPGWQVLNPHGGVVDLDQDQPREGRNAARITSPGPTVSLVSHAFAPPATGRLALTAFIRRSRPSEGVLVRMIIEDAQGGAVYRRHGELSGNGAGGTLQVGTEWGQHSYRVRVDDLPLDAPFPVRVRFEVSGKGTVWIDDVQLFDLSFLNEPGGARNQPSEQLELNLIILEAQKALDDGAYSDCLESLDGYWPKFLTAHVKAPASSVRVANASSDSVESEESREGTSPSVPDRIKRLVVPVFK